MADSKTVHTPTTKVKMTIADKMRAHHEYYDALSDGLRTYEPVDERIIQAGRLLTAAQGASAARKNGSYSFEHVSDDVKLIIWSEDPIAQDETVCIVEFGAKRATFIRDANVAHPELHERLAGLVGWEICTVDGMIARAATEWAYAH